MDRGNERFTRFVSLQCDDPGEARVTGACRGQGEGCPFAMAEQDQRSRVVRAQLTERSRRARPLDPAQLYAVHNPKSIWEREWRANELRTGLQAVASEVEPKTFQAFQLFVLEEWPTEKVARFLGLSRQSVYQAKSRVIRKLRARLADSEDDDG